MRKKRRVSAVAAGSAGMLLALGAAAERPSVLLQTSGGLWELSGGPAGDRNVRQCIADPALLAQIQHRRARCERTVVRDQPTSAEVHYTCPSGGFGRSTIAMITPRSFRIETQGISEGAPFHYVLQARRIGNCTIH